MIVRNPTRENFLAAKTMIYNGMRLIDDEIGIFHVRSATAEGSDYFDVWEDVIISDHPSHAIAFPFGTEEPGDKIDMFREERRKFFADDSRTVRGPPSVGSLFLLPGCFYFPLQGGLSRMSGDDIAEASSLAASIMGAYKWILREGDEAEHFNRIVEKKAMEMLEEDFIDAFRVVARELFFESKFMRDVLWKIISTADENAVEGTSSSIEPCDFG